MDERLVAPQPGTPRTRDPKPLPAIHRLLPSVYYGWVIAAAAGVVSAVTVGVGFYGMTVLLNGFQETRGFSTVDVSRPTVAYFTIPGFAGLLVGRLVDRHGVRPFLVAGSLLMASCLLALGRVQEPAQLWLLYPLMALGFSMSSNIPMGALMTRWFVGLRARALSVSQSGVSLGGVVLVPVATHLLHERGLAAATGLMAVLLVGIAVPVALFVLREDPLDHGLSPDGNAALARHNPLLDDAHQRRTWSRREAAFTGSFWGLAISFGLILFCQQSLLIHQIALFRERIGDAQVGAYAVSITAAASAAGRLTVGSFADRVSKRRVTVALMLVQAAALLAFSVASGRPALFLIAACFGLTIGNIFMLQSLLVGELFGIVSFGTVFGMVGLFSLVAGGLGPWVLGEMVRVFGTYGPGLWVLAAMAVGAAYALSRVEKPPEGPMGREQE